MKTIIATSLLAATLLTSPFATHAAEGTELAKQEWSFDNLRTGWNKDELYRGYTVATQVCMACHSFKYISHRDFMKAGFTEAEAATMAKNLSKGLNEKLLTGMDDASAKETFGKVPPDLSVMNKAREGGADYVYAVLTGFSEDPQEIKEALPNGLPENAHFNRAFAGHAIAMPNPLTGPDMVTYHDGTKASTEQMAHDVTTFMQWTAEPERFDRERLGVYVLMYLFVFTVMAYITKKAIWKKVKH